MPACPRRHLNGAPGPEPAVKQAPVLETARLLLRPHRLSDYPALHAMWADPAVYCHITGKPSTPEEAWARLLRYAGHWALMDYGYWAVEKKSTTSFIGEMGFADYHRDIDPPFGDTPELGWALASHAHGKGYATEALLAIAAWGDENLPHPKTACMIAPENTASLHVATKIGFVETGRATYKSEPSIIFHRLAIR